MAIAPSQLHGLTQLAFLYLAGVSFNPAELLGMLGKMTKLQRLHVVQQTEFGWDEHPGDPVWPAPSALYAA
jgi:hypothetical protein